MRELERLRPLMKELPADIRAAQVQAEKREILSFEIQDVAGKGAEYSSVTELFVSAGGGFYYTQNLEEDPEEMLAKAARLARYSNSGGAGPMVKGSRLKTDCGQVPKTEELKAAAAALEKAIREGIPGSKPALRMTRTKETRGLINSLDTDICCENIRLEAELEMAEIDGGIPCFLNCGFSARSLKELTARLFLRRIGQWRENRLPSGTLNAGRYRTLLDGEVVTNILATAWQMFTGANYRNGATPYAGDLSSGTADGKQVFSPCLTIEDLPFMEHSGYGCAVDCEGTPARALTVAFEGRLTGLLHTLETASEMGQTPCGCSGRKALLSGNIHTQIQAIPRNFCIRPGKCTEEELLDELHDGVYVFESYDVFHSINIASGEFHIPCKAILVENGQKKRSAEGITINGNLKELFSHVTACGNSLFVRPMDLLKSYAVAAPSLLVSEIAFTGSQG